MGKASRDFQVFVKPAGAVCLDRAAGDHKLLAFAWFWISLLTEHLSLSI